MQAQNRHAGPEKLKPRVLPFYDDKSSTFSYVVQDPTSPSCAIIDSVLDYNPVTGEINHRSADAIVRYVEMKKLDVEWIIETHVHSDHLSAAQYLKDVLGGKTAISEKVTRVQQIMSEFFNTGDEVSVDGSQFDYLFRNEEEYCIGNMLACALHTPGHTPACMTHVIGDAAFVGDTLLMPDAGTARADFPGGDAAQLFHSIRKILRLPARTRIFVCHDYGTDDRQEVEYLTTVKSERDSNVHINARVVESDFVRERQARDRTLSLPELMLPAIQVNMRGGHLPEPESNDVCYLKIPVGVWR